MHLILLSLSNMCSSPFTIPNPYYGLGSIGLNKYHNTHTSKISIPCGKCSQCVSQKQNFYTQRVQMESLRSHLFFLTLTYNELIPSIDMCGYKLNFPDILDWQKMVKRMRKDGYEFRYFVVQEYGTDKGRPHFHAIIAVDKSDNRHYSVIERDLYHAFLRYWCVNVGTHRKPIYKPLLTYVRRRNKCSYDFHYIEPMPNHDNDVSFYITKYIVGYDKRVEKLLQKFTLDTSIPEGTDKVLRSLVKPRRVMSKDFGDWRLPQVQDWIINNLDFYCSIPQYVDIYTGKRSMLSRYYAKHLLSLDYMDNRFDKFSSGKDFTFEVLDIERTFERRRYCNEMLRTCVDDDEIARLKKLRDTPVFKTVVSPSFSIDDDSTILDDNQSSERKLRVNDKFLQNKILMSKKYL